MSESESSEEQRPRTVVFPVDASEHCSKAFDWFTNTIHREGDKLVIVHAQEMPPMPAAPYPYGLVNVEEYKHVAVKSDEDVRKLLESFGKRCSALKNTKCKLHKEAGRAGEVLCKVAHNEKADLIVMGSRGLGSVRRTILGSVSDYAIHHTDVPVTIVPAGGHPVVSPSPSAASSPPGGAGGDQEHPHVHHGVKDSDIEDPSILMS